MANLRVRFLEDIMGQLPELRHLDPASSSLPKRVDLFICALGFEPRCLTIPEALSQEGPRASKAIYCQYSTNAQDNGVNRGRLLESLQRIAAQTVSLEADDVLFTQRLRELFVEPPDRVESADRAILVDVSVMANRVLMRVMKSLLETDRQVIILYSEAATYHPSSQEYHSAPGQWSSDSSLGLERGVSSVAVSGDYPGYHLDQLPDCVLLFPSFKNERARAVIGRVDPALAVGNTDLDKIVWFLGVPHRSENRWRLAAMREINAVKSDAVQYEVDTFDYRESLRKLEHVYVERVGKYRFSLAPMGSKMQAIGAALFAYLHQDVAVVFATPFEYNAAHYSDGCLDRWMIDFGNMERVRSLLDSVGMLTVED
jgi:hypothetical protein